MGPIPVQTFAGAPPPSHHPLISLVTGVGDQLFMEIRRFLRYKIPVTQLGSLTGPTSRLC